MPTPTHTQLSNNLSALIRKEVKNINNLKSFIRNQTQFMSIGPPLRASGPQFVFNLQNANDPTGGERPAGTGPLKIHSIHYRAMPVNKENPNRPSKEVLNKQYALLTNIKQREAAILKAIKQYLTGQNREQVVKNRRKFTTSLMTLASGSPAVRNPRVFSKIFEQGTGRNMQQMTYAQLKRNKNIIRHVLSGNKINNEKLRLITPQMRENILRAAMINAEIRKTLKASLRG